MPLAAVLFLLTGLGAVVGQVCRSGDDQLRIVYGASIVTPSDDPVDWCAWYGWETADVTVSTQDAVQALAAACEVLSFVVNSYNGFTHGECMRMDFSGPQPQVQYIVEPESSCGSVRAVLCQDAAEVAVGETTAYITTINFLNQTTVTATETVVSTACAATTETRTKRRGTRTVTTTRTLRSCKADDEKAAGVASRTSAPPAGKLAGQAPTSCTVSGLLALSLSPEAYSDAGLACAQTEIVTDNYSLYHFRSEDSAALHSLAACMSYSLFWDQSINGFTPPAMDGCMWFSADAASQLTAYLAIGSMGPLCSNTPPNMILCQTSTLTPPVSLFPTAILGERATVTVPEILTSSHTSSRTVTLRTVRTETLVTVVITEHAVVREPRTTTVVTVTRRL